MLGLCVDGEHGYYRGPKCLECNKEGKFLMNEHETDTVGRLLAGILRHFPDKFELYMDGEGWVNVHDMVDAVKKTRRRMRWLNPHHFIGMVETDEKGRFQVEGDMIRATYGHTVDVNPILPDDNVPEILFYPVAQAELSLVLDEGLLPSDKKKVHLSKTYDGAVVAGKYRYDDADIIRVDAKKAMADGHFIGEAGTTVYTTDKIPGSYIEVIDEEDVPEYQDLNLEVE